MALRQWHAWLCTISMWVTWWTESRQRRRPHCLRQRQRRVRHRRPHQSNCDVRRACEYRLSWTWNKCGAYRGRRAEIVDIWMTVWAASQTHTFGSKHNNNNNNNNNNTYRKLKEKHQNYGTPNSQFNRNLTSFVSADVPPIGLTKRNLEAVLRTQSTAEKQHSWLENCSTRNAASCWLAVSTWPREESLVRISATGGHWCGYSRGNSKSTETPSLASSTRNRNATKSTTRKLLNNHKTKWNKAHELRNWKWGRPCRRVEAQHRQTVKRITKMELKWRGLHYLDSPGKTEEEMACWCAGNRETWTRELQVLDIDCRSSREQWMMLMSWWMMNN